MPRSWCRWERDAGFTVYMPSLFGRDGAIPDVNAALATFQRACVSAEFRAFASQQSSPVTSWLRALARLAQQECGGPAWAPLACVSPGTLRPP